MLASGLNLRPIGRSVFVNSGVSATLGRWKIAGLSITGQMKVSTLQEGFLKEFGLTLRVYDGRSFAEPTQTLGQVRKTKSSGEPFGLRNVMASGQVSNQGLRSTPPRLGLQVMSAFWNPRLTAAFLPKRARFPMGTVWRYPRSSQQHIW